MDKYILKSYQQGYFKIEDLKIFHEAGWITKQQFFNAIEEEYNGLQNNHYESRFS